MTTQENTKDLPSAVDPNRLEVFLRGYMVCALWSSVMSDDPEQHAFDYRYYPDDFDEATAADMRSDCEDFMAANAELLSELDMTQAGHDFWLTRNRHGAGFWDRGLGKVGEKLTAAAIVYGSSDLFETEDGKVGLEFMRNTLKP